MVGILHEFVKTKFSALSRYVFNVFIFAIEKRSTCSWMGIHYVTMEEIDHERPKLEVNSCAVQTYDDDVSDAYFGFPPRVR